MCLGLICFCPVRGSLCRQEGASWQLCARIKPQSWTPLPQGLCSPVLLASSLLRLVCDSSGPPHLMLPLRHPFLSSFPAHCLFSSLHPRSNFEGLTLVIPSGDNRYISSARLVSWYPNPTSFARSVGSLLSSPASRAVATSSPQKTLWWQGQLVPMMELTGTTVA